MALYIGLMSGTSMDGIDAALVEFSAGDDQPRLIATHARSWPEHLVHRLHTICTPGENEIDQMGELDQKVAEEFAFAVNDLLQIAGIPKEEICAIGSHGQTIRHRPELGFTLQIGNGARLAAMTDIDVICDFRMKDIALGGQGAPLVPAFHQAVFGIPDTSRYILNIGGISNVSVLPGHADKVFGFDTGPGNTLLDSWYRQHHTGSYDKNGAWAASGQLHQPLLQDLLTHPYFSMPYPKSTGRETFTPAWMQQHICNHPDISAADVQRTLLEFTAVSVCDALQVLDTSAHLYLCGGGAHNPLLSQRIADLLPDWQVNSTQTLGMHPDWVEAIAFAWLAHCFCERRPGNLPAVTGARQKTVLGAFYPAK
ncbi:MAG: anhydro-N-acetylmuramic acid kinase [Tolumonas sp.]|nr:MAG: anhydro-N-acetylmuramic acid kinase [Tolumonas sp.]